MDRLTGLSAPFFDGADEGEVQVHLLLLANQPQLVHPMEQMECLMSDSTEPRPESQ